MKHQLKAFFLLLSLALSSATGESFSYVHQEEWTGQCQTGNQQSPIDIPCQDFITACPARKNYQIYWKDPYANFGGSTHEDLKTFFSNQNSWVLYSNETNDYIFTSAQFHLHSPSEHTINGVQYPL